MELTSAFWLVFVRNGRSKWFVEEGGEVHLSRWGGQEKDTKLWGGYQDDISIWSSNARHAVGQQRDVAQQKEHLVHRV